MTSELSKPLKTVTVWACIIVGGLLTASIVFIALVSIWEGFRQIDRSASWFPIIAGTVVSGAAVWLYVRGARAIYSRLHAEELLNL